MVGHLLLVDQVVVGEVVATDGTDPDTLFVKYRNSGSSGGGNGDGIAGTLNTGSGGGGADGNASGAVATFGGGGGGAPGIVIIRYLTS